MTDLEELESKWSMIPSKLEKDLTGKTGTLVLLAITGYAKNLAHVDTGEMRNSIMSLSANQEGDNIVYKVIARAPHSIFEEYGIGSLGDPAVPHNPDAKNPRKAHPFMRPAIGIDADGTGRTNKATIEKILQGAVDEVFR